MRNAISRKQTCKYNVYIETEMIIHVALLPEISPVVMYKVINILLHLSTQYTFTALTA